MSDKHAFYNDHDGFAAEWLRNLIGRGLLQKGTVDERSITEIMPDDTAGFQQCHFFAGIGGWPYALRLAGWPDEWPVWTGSPPCQPFSAAGKRRGFDDERHLWPAWFSLIKQCRPPVIFGEQVDAAIRHGWLDLVQDELEGIGYAFAAIGLPAACVGAPHIRQRLWFVAYSGEQRFDRQHALLQRQAQGGLPETARRSEPGRVDYADSAGLERRDREQERGDGCGARASGLAGFWGGAEWIPCRDGRWRPIEPGTFPLADGVSSRVGRLRAYGNAIVPQVAAEVIRATMEYLVDGSH